MATTYMADGSAWRDNGTPEGECVREADGAAKDLGEALSVLRNLVNDVAHIKRHPNALRGVWFAREIARAFLNRMGR